MEPPSRLATNICCLGKAASIAWTAYTWIPQDDSSTGSLEVEQLYLADLAIRRTEGYSHFDQHRRCLWVFDVPLDRAKKNSLHTGTKDTGKLIETFGFRETARGILFSHDKNQPDENANDTNIYGKRERSDDTTEYIKINSIATAKNHHLNASADQENKVENAPIPGSPSQTHLLLAIQSTCIWELERSHHFIRLGNGLFCSVDYTEFDYISMSPDKLSFDSPPRRALWSLEVVWHDAGAILVSYYEVANRDVLTPLDDADCNVVLAPFGWNAHMILVSSLNGNTQQSNEHGLGAGDLWRSHCLDLLRQYGLGAQNYQDWAVVKIHTAVSDDTQYHVEWPRQLCLVIAHSSNENPQATTLDRSSDKARTDPLQEIAEWMSDTKNREKLVKEQLSSKSGGNKLWHSKAVAEEEVLAHLQSRYEESLDAQTIAGIYPTPPDVNKSHGQTHTEMNPSLLGQVGESYLEAAADVDDSGGPQSAQDGDPDADNYDPFKDDDLFDDMDTGMDGDNGVTEDDFRFFDEPDELDGPELALEPSILVEQVVQESPLDILNNDQQDSSEPVQGLETEAVLAQQIGVLETTPLDAAIPEVSVHIIPETAAAESKHVKELRPNTGSQGFDAKYSAFGKYAWNKIQRPTTTTPYTRIEQEKGIPSVRENILTSPSTTNSPSSESFQEIDDAQAGADDNSDEANLFLEQGRLLSKLTTGCKTFSARDDPDAISKSFGRDSTLMVPEESEIQGQASIQLAQIVADQSIFYDYLMREHDQDFKSRNSYTMTNLVGTMLQGCFQDSQALTLRQCAQLHTDFGDVEDSGISFDALIPPMVRIKRADTVLDITYPALEFWKELSIKPLHGPKNVTAFCLCQEGETYRVGALSFLQSMEDSYRSQNLGSHSAGHPSLRSYPQGIVPVPGMTTSPANGKVINSFCIQLGKSLSALSTVPKTIVVYIVKPAEDSVSLVTLCILFHKIFESYASMFRKVDRPPDLVLQLIPSFVAVADMSIIFPNLKHCNTISRIVYDRCPVADASKSVYASGSMVQLAQPLPSSIDFRQSSDNSLNPMATRETFHLAYAYTEGSSWLSAALIESYGSKQWSASYYLGETPKRQFVLTAVINEIWDIMWLAAGYRRTYDIVTVKTTKWTTEEINFWKNLAQGSKISLKLLAYDISCPILLKQSDDAANVEALESELVVVPPTPDVSSPDATGGKADEQDSVTRLVDARNQAWWIASKDIITMRNDSLAIQEYSNAGYFIHGNNEVKSLHVVDCTHAVDLASIAEAYQGLRILAQTRCVHKHLPWHIAIAEGAHLSLERHLSNYKIV